MTAPVLIAQISDLHIKRPGERAYEMIDTAAALERCIAHLNRFRPRPAFVVISGDLVDRGLEEEYAHVRLIAAGHVHRAVTTLFAGVPASICPAPNHAVDLDFAAERPPSLRIEPPAFHLHAWFAGEGFGKTVTHLVPIGEFPGPYPFF